MPDWVKDNEAALAPPVCNKLVYGDGEWLVQVVGGPNDRRDCTRSLETLGALNPMSITLTPNPNPNPKT